MPSVKRGPSCLCLNVLNQASHSLGRDKMSYWLAWCILTLLPEPILTKIADAIYGITKPQSVMLTISRDDKICYVMMMSWNGNIFCITGPIWGEFTSHCWVPLTKASVAELSCFLWSEPEQTLVNNPDADDLRHHHAQDDVAVMLFSHRHGKAGFQGISWLYCITPVSTKLRLTLVVLNLFQQT